jgi:hypothetical protein
LRLKRIIATILLFFAITSQLGTYVAYLIQQEQVKEDIARQIASELPNSELVKIQGSKNLDWEEAGKEFYVGHQFYDVVKTEMIQGVVWYYCINDKMQTKLYHDFAKSFNTNDSNTTNQKESKHTMKFPTTYFLVQTFIINPFKRTSSDTANLFYEEKLSTIFSVILVPPPQQI